MKTVLLVRHAKSSWEKAGQADFDRPLNERGFRDAPAMAEKLLADGIKIEHIISSTALRAQTTARFFQEIFDVPPQNFEAFDELYLAPAHRFMSIIARQSETVKHLALFAHNPGITDAVNEMRVAQLDNMPTCGVFGVQVEDSVKWADFDAAEKNFYVFDYPRNING